MLPVQSFNFSQKQNNYKLSFGLNVTECKKLVNRIAGGGETLVDKFVKRATPLFENIKQLKYYDSTAGALNEVVVSITEPKPNTFKCISKPLKALTDNNLQGEFELTINSFDGGTIADTVINSLNGSVNALNMESYNLAETNGTLKKVTTQVLSGGCTIFDPKDIMPRLILKQRKPGENPLINLTDKKKQQLTEILSLTPEKIKDLEAKVQKVFDILK